MESCGMGINCVHAVNPTGEEVVVKRFIDDCDDEGTEVREERDGRSDCF